MANNQATDLRIVIAGAGMGGLTSALALAKKGFKHIDVYENASSLGFVGAGIQLAPNLARVLDNLGCWRDIEAEAVNITDTKIRRGATDDELAHVVLDKVEATYGYKHMVGHRASLAGSIFKACQAQPHIKFHWATSVTSVNSFGPKPVIVVQPRNGEAYMVDADVLLAADGVKSVIRQQMLEELSIDATVVDTNQAAYRIMLKREELLHDPELLALIDSGTVTRWIGEKRHIIAYSVSNNKIYNLSTIQPDLNFASAPSTTYTTKGSKTQMLQTFSDFCPKVQRMLNLVPEGEVCEWKLRVHHPLPTWVHNSTALVGDACHPTLPHLAQGAAQAIEDAGVLSVVMSKLPDTSAESINTALKVYEAVRKERAYTLVEMAAASGRALHLGEGAAKEERDKQFAALKEGKGKVPDKWADSDVMRMIYGHDCMHEADVNFERLFSELSGKRDKVVETSVDMTEGQNPAVIGMSGLDSRAAVEA